MESTSEPPKPITRLADTIGRVAQREPNLLGRYSLLFVTVGWLCIAGLALGRRLHWWGPDFRPFWCSVAIDCAIVIAGLILSIVALVRATGHHSRRREAVVALVFGGVFVAIAATVLVLNWYIIWSEMTRWPKPPGGA